jgi:hypothetical protein
MSDPHIRTNFQTVLVLGVGADQESQVEVS